MADLLGKLVVRSHAPKRRAVLLASSVLLALVVIYGAFELGRYDAGFRVVDSVRGALSASTRIRRLEAENNRQREQLEAAAVARGAQARGVRFMAVKAISDERNFVMPAMDRFLDGSGQFKTAKFVIYAAARPWLWASVIQLDRNSGKASAALCAELDRYLNQSKKPEFSGPELHPISKVIS